MYSLRMMQPPRQIDITVGNEMSQYCSEEAAASNVKPWMNDAKKEAYTAMRRSSTKASLSVPFKLMDSGRLSPPVPSWTAQRLTEYAEASRN